ncbi:unnamed protein product, partial [Musa banksii]
MFGKADSIPIYEAEKKSSTWQTSSLYPQRDNASWVVAKTTKSRSHVSLTMDCSCPVATTPSTAAVVAFHKILQHPEFHVEPRHGDVSEEMYNFCV